MFSWLKSSRNEPGSYPPAPPGKTVYAVGDIHGRSDCLAQAQALIDRDVAQRRAGDQTTEVYLGDYIDRGPDSKGVLDLLAVRAESVTTVLLRGNHEIIMESFLRGMTSFEQWRAVGGLETLISYGVDARALLAGGGEIRPRDLAERMPLSHLRLFSVLQQFQVIGDYFFVHAGLRPGVALGDQSVEDLTSIRDDFLGFSGDFGFVVVHGHTPVRAIDFQHNRINIDTGAYVTNRLSVIRIDGSGVSVLDKMGV